MRTYFETHALKWLRSYLWISAVISSWVLQRHCWTETHVSQQVAAVLTAKGRIADATRRTRSRVSTEHAGYSLYLTIGPQNRWPQNAPSPRALGPHLILSSPSSHPSPFPKRHLNLFSRFWKRHRLYHRWSSSSVYSKIPSHGSVSDRVSKWVRRFI